MRKRLDSWFTFIVLRPLFKIILNCFFSLEIEGSEILKQYSSAIFAGNHTGFLDGPIILSGTNRPLLFIMSQGVLSWPVVGWLVRGIGILVIHHTKAKRTLMQAIQYLKTSQSICIFPEGDLSRDGQMRPFHAGVAFLHTRSQAPIIPFAIHGGYEAWRWGQWFPKPRKIYLKFGEPIMFSHENKEIILEKLLDEIVSMKQVLEVRDNQSEPYLTEVIDLCQKQAS